MYTLIILLHVIACLILIISILLQAGRGGGLSELFGAGSSQQTIFGTRASTFLTRATTVAAIVFLLTCISLTVFSSRRVKSLMTGVVESEEASVVIGEEETEAEEKAEVVEQAEEAQTSTEEVSETEPETSPQ